VIPRARKAGQGCVDDLVRSARWRCHCQQIAAPAMTKRSSDQRLHLGRRGVNENSVRDSAELKARREGRLERLEHCDCDDIAGQPGGYR
jgi:hypothetical protein